MLADRKDAPKDESIPSKFSDSLAAASQSPVQLEPPVTFVPPPPSYVDSRVDPNTAQQTSVQELDSTIDSYIAAKPTVSPEESLQMQREIENMARRLQETYPDPATRQALNERATAFAKAPGEEKVKHAKTMKRIVKGLLVVCAAPIVMTGSLLVVTGSIITGTGKVINGLGHVFSKDLKI